MSDSVTDIKDLGAVTEAAETWDTAQKSLKECQGRFKGELTGVITTPGDPFAAYASEIESALDALLQYSNDMLLAYKKVLDDLPDPEKPTDPPTAAPTVAPTVQPPIVTPVYGSPTPPGSSHPTTPDSPTTPGTETPTTSTTGPVDTTSPIIAGIDLTGFDFSSLRGMSTADINIFMSSMVALAQAKNQTLDEFLRDGNNFDDIQKAVLSSDILPADFKDAIRELAAGDEEYEGLISASLLRSLVNGEHPEVFDIDALGTGITYAYLEDVAASKDITVQALLSDSQYVSTLRAELNKLNNVADMISGWDNLGDEEFQNQLRHVYQGDEVDGVPDESIDVVRSMMDFISDAVTDAANDPNVTVTSEDLLTGTEYASTLKEAADRLGKTCLFMGVSGKLSDKQMKQNVSNMYSGTNPLVYGLYEDGLEEYKKEVDKTAKSKSVTSKEFLTNSQYAEDAKNMLNSSENTKIIGQIYRNQDARYNQEICNNIYNATIDRSGEIVSKTPKTEPTTRREDVA